ncbi:uncharacterized protein KZ484_003026 [Pholidichthys leucotaenia]
MAAALTLVLFGCLLQGTQSQNKHRLWKVTVPTSVGVLSGSCGIVPCSFTIDSYYKDELDHSCKASWTKKVGLQKVTVNTQTTGSLKDKDCTTTFNNVADGDRDTYYFRLECNNKLKYNFPGVKIEFKADPPPSVTLTPSVLKVKEGSSVNLTCSAPAPCLSHLPTLTWTPNLGRSVETLQGNQDQPKVQTSVLTFTASHLHHGQKISCSAVYKKKDGHPDVSAKGSLTLDVQYSPKNTSISVSPSGPVTENTRMTLTCNSNANPAVRTYRYYRSDGDQETLIGDWVYYNHYQGLFLPFIIRLVAFLLVTAGFLLFVIRVQQTYQTLKSYLTCESNAVAMHQLQMEEKNESMQKDLLKAQKRIKKGLMWFYVSVKKKKEKADATYRNPSAGYYLEEEKWMAGGKRNHFLGFVNFYRRFINNYSVIALSLTRITSPKKAFRWTEEAAAVFTTLKERFSSSPILTQVDPALQCLVEMDASDSGTKMAAALTLVLFGCLLQGTQSQNKHRLWKVTVPTSVGVLSGSCGIVPCSFAIDSYYKDELDHSCKASWTKKVGLQEVTVNTQTTGSLKDKDCTTTFNNVAAGDRDTYCFRLECNNTLKYSFPGVKIEFKADPPPSVTLTPSVLKVKEGSSVNLTCSAPAPCLSHPPTLTWTPNLGRSVETLQGNQNQPKVQTSVLTFTASHLHHGQKISCSAVYKKKDGHPDVSAKGSLTLDVQFSPKNTSISVSPSGPVTENTRMTLTCNSNANPAVRTYRYYRSDGDQETLIGTGSIITTEASKFSRFYFCEAENGLRIGRSGLKHIDVWFPPQILPSSDCSKVRDQFNCSCGVMGNPSSRVLWYLDGLPVNQSDMFQILNETLNATAWRSIIIVKRPQETDLSTLVCSSVNDVGSVRERFCVNNLQTAAESRDQGLFLPFIITLVALLLIIAGFLLFVIRVQQTYQTLKSHLTCESNTVAMNQLQMEDKNEVPNSNEEPLYANSNMLGWAGAATTSDPNCTSVPNFGPVNAEGPVKSSDKNRERTDVIYMSVKKKKEKADITYRNPSAGYYLEEEKWVAGGRRNHVSNALEMGRQFEEVESKTVKTEAECTYAQVKFKRSGKHK